MSARHILAVAEERHAARVYLLICAARTAYRLTKLPWWAFVSRARCTWSIATLTMAAHAIEGGEHHEAQASFLREIEPPARQPRSGVPITATALAELAAALRVPEPQQGLLRRQGYEEGFDAGLAAASADARAAADIAVWPCSVALRRLAGEIDRIGLAAAR